MSNVSTRRSLEAVVTTLSTTKDKSEFARAVNELVYFKRNFNWADPRGSLLESISYADRLVFQRTHVNVKTFQFMGPLLGVLELGVILMPFPLLLAVVLALMAKVLNFYNPWLAFEAAFLGVYSAAVTHELAHWLAMSASCHPLAIYGTPPFAGVRLQIRCDKEHLSVVDVVLLYTGGSIGNIVLAILMVAVAASLGSGASLVTESVVLANVAIGIANLMPAGIGSTDGALLLRALRSRSGRRGGGGF